MGKTTSNWTSTSGSHGGTLASASPTPTSPWSPSTGGSWTRSGDHHHLQNNHLIIMMMTGVETRHRLPHQQPRQPPSSVRTKQEGVRQQELSNLEVDISILMPTQSYADSSDYTPTVSLSIHRDWLSAFHAQVLNLKLVLQTIHRFHNRFSQSRKRS